jgi:hypothetical protein
MLTRAADGPSRGEFGNGGDAQAFGIAHDARRYDPDVVEESLQVARS